MGSAGETNGQSNTAAINPANECNLIFVVSFYSCLGGGSGINFFELIGCVPADILVGVVQKFYEQRDCLLAQFRKLIANPIRQNVGGGSRTWSDSFVKPFDQKWHGVGAGSTGGNHGGQGNLLVGAVHEPPQLRQRGFGLFAQGNESSGGIEVNLKRTEAIRWPLISQSFQQGRN